MKSRMIIVNIVKHRKLLKKNNKGKNVGDTTKQSHPYHVETIITNCHKTIMPMSDL